MDELQIRTAVAEALEISGEDLQMDTELTSFPSYDSTARLSLMICLSDATGRAIELCALQKIRTYGDVVLLAEKATLQETCA
jgi:acyl carrier protein